MSGTPEKEREPQIPLVQDVRLLDTAPSDSLRAYLGTSSALEGTL
jgi:hypothetical protein